MSDYKISIKDQWKNHYSYTYKMEVKYVSFPDFWTIVS